MGMLLVLGGTLVLWKPHLAATSVLDTHISEPTAASTPEPTPEPTPLYRESGSAVDADTYLQDGRKVEILPGQSYWGMERLAVTVKEHRCRYMTGSGTLLPDYQCGDPVPESEAVEDEWFSDACFIGNSLQQGFMLYGGLRTADIFATQSISITNIYYEDVVNTGDGLISIMDAMAQKQYSKVFILLGINELGFSKGYFTESYGALIDQVRELEPDAQIYLESITPITKAESDSESMFTASRVNSFNELIRQLAADKEAHYLNIFDVWVGEDGYMPGGYTADGVHPYPRFYPLILDYLKTHTITEVRK